MIKKLFLLSVVPCVVVFGLLEIALRTIGYDYTPRQKILSKPTVAGFTRTVEQYFDTVFDPPGYIWIRADRVAAEKPSGERTYTWPAEKTPGVRRVAFLGGSTSEPSGPRPYPTRCVDLLNAVAGTEAFELLNVACSSYSSHQSLIALRRYALPRDPDVVVVYHGWNDTFLSPSQDGFSDKEKDFLVTKANIQEKSSPRWAVLGRLKTTHLVGRIVDACDLSWPRPRVTENDLYRNLTAMARECASRKIPMVLVYRPRADTAPAYMEQLPEHVIKAYALWNTGKDQLYQGIHDMVLRVQRRVAQENPDVRVADANAYFDSLPEVKGPIADPTAIALFVKDSIHNTELGKQRLAEVVARAVAPDLSDKVVQYVNAFDYWKQLAGEFNDLLSPFEAEYAVEQALALDASREGELKPAVDTANNTKDFYKLFYFGRWWGSKDGYSTEQKVGMLEKCLELQPSDYGVAEQIFRVALYTEKPDVGAQALKRFQSENLREKHQVLRLRFMLWAQARQWDAAEQAAREIIAVVPGDPDANGFLQQLHQARAQQAMGRVQP
jgi:lysophospholipase L1-like esterase